MIGEKRWYVEIDDDTYLTEIDGVPEQDLGEPDLQDCMYYSEAKYYADIHRGRIKEWNND